MQIVTKLSEILEVHFPAASLLTVGNRENESNESVVRIHLWTN
jgi:hypothetical protein